MITRAERDDLVRRIRAAEEALAEDGPGARERTRRREALYSLVAEYGDRLPRARLSLCPFSGKPYRRGFDPFGLDGPAWDVRPMVPFDDPDPGPHFRVLLGAVDFRGRAPTEIAEEVQPGPPVPFVVPKLLELPGMVAVIARITFATGDVGYPIAYFADQPTPPEKLHQEWGRLDHWFRPEGGGDARWLASNYEWDFDLEPWIDRGKVLWVLPDIDDAAATPTLHRHGGPGATPCPFVGLAGARAPQLVQAGELEELDLPDGTPFNPFDE